MSMKERIRKYMEDFGSITTREAFIELGCSRLSEYIRQLRLETDVVGEWQTGVNRYGEKVEYKKYYFADRKEESKNDKQDRFTL